MKTALVGYTGFVGSNLLKSHKFDGLYNSKNIQDAFGTCPDLLIYSGIRAEKFVANKYPEKDYDIILNAIENIKNVAAPKTRNDLRRSICLLNSLYPQCSAHYM